MPFVVDASVAGAWALQDETAPLADACLVRLADEPATVPALFWFEIRNLLVVNERRRRLSAAESSAFLGKLHRLPIGVDDAPDGDVVMALARRHGLTVYDAAYLELARRRAVPLATLDRRLMAAGSETGVLPFVA
jgi:predicted nucleic acid-binding protein